MCKLLPGRLSRRVNTKETRKGDGGVKVSVGRRDRKFEMGAEGVGIALGNGCVG